MPLTMLVDGAVVPMTTEEEAAWLAARDARVAAAEARAVPELTCTPRQMRLAMLDLGVLDDIEAAYEGWPRAVQIAWDYAGLMERRDPLWDEIGATMEPPILPAAITDLFHLAATK